MGTYTTNYQLYMPTIGETGWGTLVNTNFSTIDSTMKSLSNRITAVENEVNGALSCTSVTTSGKVTGNGGIAGTTGTFSGLVSAKNITSTGLFPATMLLYANSSSLNIASSYYTYQNVDRNGFASIQILGTNMLDSYASYGQRTAKGIYSTEYTINTIHVESGSWSYKLVVNAYVTGTVKSTSGATYTVTGTSSEGTLALNTNQVLDILSGPITYTYKTTHSNSSQNVSCEPYMRIYNNSGQSGYYRIYPSALF